MCHFVQFESKTIFHIITSYDPFSTDDTLPKEWEGGLLGESSAMVNVYDVSCMADVAVLLKFETALSLKCNKNPVQMQGKKICSGEVYIPV